MLVLLLLTFFTITFFSQNPQKITGLVIFNSQPNQTNGVDTLIREDYPNNNFQAATGLTIGKTAGGKGLRALLQFNISSIPSTDTILNATVKVYLEAATGSSNITISVYRIISPWTESGASWNNRTNSSLWSSAGGDYEITKIDSKIFLNSSGNYYNFTITKLARNWLNGTYNNYGIILIAQNASTGNFSQISSSDSLTVAQRPEIIINHVKNAPPTINSISTDSNKTNPKEAGTDITFKINWSDIESDNSKAYICSSPNITTLGCVATTFCSTVFSSINPITCSYLTSILENTTIGFWVAVCDSGNCSQTSSENYFYINHKPLINIIQPNGGELINQSNGNYEIKFNVSDKDSNNLTASIYYGTTQNSTTNLIISNLNLTNYCTDEDNNTATTNNCTYSWNTIGIYGTYYLTIVLNDSYSTSINSSNSNFDIKSIIDNNAPQITNIQFTNNLTSGKQMEITATITDANMKSAWVSLNYTTSNLTMLNSTPTSFYTYTDAPAPGTYKLKIYADDILGQINNTIAWQEFNVTKPLVIIKNVTSPSIALPYHLIKVEGKINAITPLKNAYAYLNVPNGFTFLSNYPQNNPIGNFTVNQSKTVDWFLSTPLSEATYIMNITYTDDYSNSWNSSNAETQVTSAIGGYQISLAGYPEVESSHNYVVRSFFKQNGIPTNADSITARIYDSTGSLIVGPISMNTESTGIYNYTYAVPSAPNEGIWKTVVNATKLGISYYAQTFWKVVGGPFDIRNITINNSNINNLKISVTTENTGGANKDLTLTWDITRTDNNTKIDSGSETFMVPANSEKIWTVYPSTNYVGQVKITFIGTYSGTEKAGAYKIFSTTTKNSSNIIIPKNNGGGNSNIGNNKISQKNITPIINFTIIEKKIIYMTKNVTKIVIIKINNTGNTPLTNASLIFNNLARIYYKIIPSRIKTVLPGELKQFKIELFIKDFTGEKNVTYRIEAKNTKKTDSFKLIVMNTKAYFLREIGKLEKIIDSLKQKLQNEKKTESLEKLEKCKNMVNSLKSKIIKNNFTNADTYILQINNCIDDISPKITNYETTKTNQNLKWITIWILITILLAIIISGIYKKIKLVKFIKLKRETPSTNIPKGETIEEKIKNIEEKIK